LVSLFPPGDRAGQFGHRVTPVWTTKADTAEVGARAYGQPNLTFGELPQR
jgi:hypothetical protein